MLLKHLNLKRFCRDFNGLRPFIAKRNQSASARNIVRSRVADMELPQCLLHEYVWSRLIKWYDKTALIMKGYLNNPQSTSLTIVDGWIRTGDIGHYDEDGQFYITDRLKEHIKVKGFQVAPAELEELLRGHPAVSDAAVIGVNHSNFGEIPKAFVVLKPTLRSTPTDIRRFVDEKVAAYKRLTGGVVILENIPRTASGKILRRQLKEL